MSFNSSFAPFRHEFAESGRRTEVRTHTAKDLIYNGILSFGEGLDRWSGMSIDGSVHVDVEGEGLPQSGLISLRDLETRSRKVRELKQVPGAHCSMGPIASSTMLFEGIHVARLSQLSASGLPMKVVFIDDIALEELAPDILAPFVREQVDRGEERTSTPVVERRIPSYFGHCEGLAVAALGWPELVRALPRDVFTEKMAYQALLGIQPEHRARWERQTALKEFLAARAGEFVMRFSEQQQVVTSLPAGNGHYASLLAQVNGSESWYVASRFPFQTGEIVDDEMLMRLGMKPMRFRGDREPIEPSARNAVESQMEYALARCGLHVVELGEAEQSRWMVLAESDAGHAVFVNTKPSHTREMAVDVASSAAKMGHGMNANTERGAKLRQDLSRIESSLKSAHADRAFPQSLDGESPEVTR